MNNQEQHLNRIKLLMNYSVGSTLTENLNNIGILKEQDSRWAENMIDSKDNADHYGGNDRRKQTIEIPYFDDVKITVVEGTKYNTFEDTDTSGTLFPGLTYDETYGWYKLTPDGTKLFFPKDEFWDQYVGMTKSFKTGPTVTHENGENYHFQIKIIKDNYEWATRYYMTPQDRPDRGWQMQPGFYKTDGDKEVPYSEPTEDDLRSNGEKFFDDYKLIIQVGGSLLLGYLTAGIANVLISSFIAVEGVVVSAELAAAAAASAEITSAISALNKAKLLRLGLDFLVQGSFNVGIGMYEMNRGQDPTVSFIFAALPLIHHLPVVKSLLGNTTKFTEKECAEIVETLGKFDGSNPNIFAAMSKPARELFDSVATVAKNNPDQFQTVFREALKINAANAATNPTVAKTFIQKAADYGISKGITKESIIHFAKTAAFDTLLIGAVELIKVYYKVKNSKDMPKEEIDKIKQDAASKSTVEESINYLDTVVKEYENDEELKLKLKNDQEKIVKDFKQMADEHKKNFEKLKQQMDSTIINSKDSNPFDQGEPSDPNN